MKEVIANMGQTLMPIADSRKVVDEFRVLCDDGLPDRIRVVGYCIEGVYALVDDDWDGDGEEHQLNCELEWTNLDRVFGTRHFKCGNTGEKFGMAWEPGFCPLCGGRVKVRDRRNEGE